MRDTGEQPAASCRNCGRAVHADALDSGGWCQRCRAELVRRSSRAAWLPALGLGVLYVALLWTFGLFYSRFIIVWLALGVALVWVTYKVSRRVLFDVIRGRGVPAPKAS